LLAKQILFVNSREFWGRNEGLAYIPWLVWSG
jgi:hypothetical protein